MASPNRKISHRFGRPPKEGVRNVHRMNHQGRWFPDDGMHGKVFSGELQLASGFWIAVAWCDECECTLLDRCLARKASDYTTKRFGSAVLESLIVTEGQ